MKPFLETEEGKQWATNAATERACREQKERLEHAVLDLMAKARQSSDPVVRGAVSTCDSLQKFIKFLQGYG